MAAAIIATPAPTTSRPRRVCWPRPRPFRPRGSQGRTAPALERCSGSRKAAQRRPGRESSAPKPSRRFSPAPVSPPAGTSAERLAGLTPREIEVLRLIAAGQTAKEAARAARDRAEDRRQPHPEPLFQDRRLHPGGRCPLRARARARSIGNFAAYGNPPHVRSGRCGHPPDREPGHCGAGQGRRRG